MTKNVKSKRALKKRVFQKKQVASMAVKTQLSQFKERYKDYKRERAEAPRYKSFRLQKKIKLLQEPLPSSWSLMKFTLQFLYKNKWLFSGITIVYAAAYYLFILSNAVPSINIQALQQVVDQTFQGSGGATTRTATLLGAVLGSPRSSGANATLASFFLIVVSLMYVWAARERMNDIKIKVRDVLYQSLSPLLSVLVVLLVMSIQLIPFALATYFYTSARANSLFASGFEDLAFFIVTALAGLLSFYFISATIIALYIAAMPGMYPLVAVKAAVKLVRFRRLAVFRRIIILPAVLAVLYLILLVIMLRFFPTFTYPFIDLYTILVVPFANIYLYKLYRELL